jgi:RHS repeat-associated protein
MLINSSNAIVAKYLYDAFGNILSKSGLLADANLYRFSSKEAHPNSGLVYYLYRYYDPTLQRWPNRDPLGEPGFEVMARRRKPYGILALINAMSGRAKSELGDLYTFVSNAPIIAIDSFGLDSCGSAPPQPANSCVCAQYGNETESGTDVNLQCFCKCAGNSPWSQQVRACLACEHAKGTPIIQAHAYCYAVAVTNFFGIVLLAKLAS